MVTFAIISLVAGNVFINDTFQADDSKKGEFNAVYAECKAVERMLSPCLMMTERDDHTLVFTNIDAWYQLTVKK